MGSARVVGNAFGKSDADRTVEEAMRMLAAVVALLPLVGCSAVIHALDPPARHHASAPIASTAASSASDPASSVPSADPTTARSDPGEGWAATASVAERTERACNPGLDIDACMLVADMYDRGGGVKLEGAVNALETACAHHIEAACDRLMLLPLKTH